MSHRADARALQGERIAGRYRVEAVLGEGGMGTALLAHDEEVARRVVVKVMHAHLAARNSEIAERLAKEARIQGKLKSPHVTTVHDFGWDPSRQLHYIVMEHLDGRSLTSFLEDRGALPPSLALYIAMQIADALAEAHAQGFIHCDLKPDNVMLVHNSEDPHFVKVLDFGIARALGGIEGAPTTEAHLLMGTPAYMAPEQFGGREEIGPETDVYALGVMMYEMLSGERPFLAGDFNRMRGLHSFEPPDPLSRRLPELPGDAASLVHRALEKSKSDRFADGKALWRALRGIQILKAELIARVAGDLKGLPEELSDHLPTAPMHRTDPSGPSAARAPGARPSAADPEMELAGGPGGHQAAAMAATDPAGRDGELNDAPARQLPTLPQRPVAAAGGSAPTEAGHRRASPREPLPRSAAVTDLPTTTTLKSATGELPPMAALPESPPSGVTRIVLAAFIACSALLAASWVLWSRLGTDPNIESEAVEARDGTTAREGGEEPRDEPAEEAVSAAPEPATTDVPKPEESPAAPDSDAKEVRKGPRKEKKSTPRSRLTEGRVAFATNPGVTVWSGGRKLGTTPMPPATMETGRYILTLIGPSGHEERVAVRVKKGSTSTVRKTIE